MCNNSPPPIKKWRQSRLSFATAAITAVDKPASYSDGVKSRFSQFNVMLPAPDGNCMFNALSDQLSVLCIADVSAYQLRHDIVQYLRQHEEIVLNVDFQTEHKMTFEDYLTYMSRDGVWGDGIVLEVAVKIFDRPIFVHESKW